MLLRVLVEASFESLHPTLLTGNGSKLNNYATRDSSKPNCYLHIPLLNRKRDLVAREALPRYVWASFSLPHPLPGRHWTRVNVKGMALHQPTVAIAQQIGILQRV
ncbi:unnamed protein product [Protopolystoma xenopodis]|uniref:Uncharacterized protein n=1 Tax=Protopolystoma xenopodis TaxID=117903 RepID=A0A3S5BBE6_9PLAT|nr:unnamed protein product [Protopolystoma xenopodis]